MTSAGDSNHRYSAAVDGRAADSNGLQTYRTGYMSCWVEALPERYNRPHLLCRQCYIRRVELSLNSFMESEARGSDTVNMIAFKYKKSHPVCDEKEIQMTIQSLSHKGRFASEKTFLHHRETTVYDHSVHVAEVSLAIANSLPFSFDMDSLVRGALLHDYFLYHRNESVKTYVTHGYRHPLVAAKNAREDYGINDIEENIITRHMFPLTPIPPKYREAWVVCVADKCCATMEYLPARLTRHCHSQTLN